MSDTDRAKLHGAPLSSQEREAVRRLAMDGTPKLEVIAQDMGLSPHTVASHLRQASCKLGVFNSWTELLMTALRQGMLSIDELVAPPHVRGHGDA